MRSRLVLPVFFALSMLLAGCASGPAKTESGSKDPLYNRLGKREGITKVVIEFRETVKKDTRINRYFAGADMPHLTQMLIELACAVSGGPEPYTGRDMKKAHKGMMVTNAAFDALMEDLLFSMKKFKVGDEEQQAVMNAFNATRKDIVEIK